MSDQHQTLEDIADRIGQLPSSILDVDEPDEPEAAPSQEDEAAPQEQENSPPEQGQDEAPAEAGEEEEAEETDKDKKPASEEESDKDAPEAEEDGPVFEITLNEGEPPKEVPLSELVQGWQASQEVETIKAETAEQRRRFESRMQEIPQLVQQATAQRENELAQKIELYAQANPLGNPPPVSMLDPNSEDYNPDRYHYELRQYEDRKQRMQEAASELQQIAREHEQQQAQRRAREHEKLKAAWPELLNDNAKQAAFLKQVEDTYGLSADELRQIEDHRHFLILRDAVGYRNMKVKAPGVREKVKAKPKPVKSGIRKTDKDIQRSDYAEQRKRLKKSGRPEDAVDLLMGVDL